MQAVVDKMTHQKIYVLLIDGTEVWVPVNAKKLENNLFLILDDECYDKVNENELFQFYPGDIISVGSKYFGDGTTAEVARELVSSPEGLDRKFVDFKFKAVTNQLEINRETAYHYKHEIHRVLVGSSKGQYFYPRIIEYVESLNLYL